LDEFGIERFPWVLIQSRTQIRQTHATGQPRLFAQSLKHGRQIIRKRLV
jgi:hypothetical protein